MQLLMIFLMVFAFLLTACDSRTAKEDKEHQSVFIPDLDEEKNSKIDRNEE